MRKPLPEFTKTNQFLLSSSKIESQKAVSSKEADSFFLSILRPGPCPDAVQRRDAGRSSQRAKSPFVAAATSSFGRKALHFPCPWQEDLLASRRKCNRSTKCGFFAKCANHPQNFKNQKRNPYLPPNFPKPLALLPQQMH